MKSRGAAILVLSAILLSVVIFGEYTEIAAASGAVEPEGGYIVVSASQTGKVTRLMVREGGSINADTPLAEVSSQQFGADGQNVNRRILELLHQQLNLIETKVAGVDKRLAQKRHWIDERLKMSHYQTVVASNGLKSLEPAVLQMKDMITRYEYLVHENAESRDMLSKKMADLTTLQSRVLTSAQQVYQLERQSIELRAEQADLEQQARSEKLSLQIDIEKTNQAIELAAYQNGSLVTAGVAGRVVVTSVQQGQYINTGDTLFMVAPERRRVLIRLDMPAEATARVCVGQRVNLRYGAFPYQKYGIQTGRIISISGGPVREDARGREHPATRGSYRVMVQPDTQTIRHEGLDLSIPAGASVEANIEVANERIIDWIYGILLRK